jgi:hypothetical protein
MLLEYTLIYKVAAAIEVECINFTWSYYTYIAKLFANQWVYMVQKKIMVVWEASRLALYNLMDVIMHWLNSIKFILHFLAIVTEEDSVLSLV